MNCKYKHVYSYSLLNFVNTVEPPITDPGLVGPLPFTALKTLTDLALLYSLY